MRTFSTSRGHRRGTVTVIVVSFLVLFFILALTFALYSIAEADNTKVYRDGANGASASSTGGYDGGTTPEGDPIFNEVLSNVIYGVQDGLPGAFNVLRGHDLASKIYGYNPSDPTGATQAFDGYGRVSPVDMYQGTAVNIPPQLANMVNYSWVPSSPFFNGMMLEAHNNFYRNPRTNARTPAPAGPPTWTYRYYAPNANYTYPDLNNLYLAAMDPKSGKVLSMSYHRRDLLNDTATGTEFFPPGPLPTSAAPGTQSNPWTNFAGRHLMLRPRPVDHQWPANSGTSLFPYPTMNPDGTTYGDVINLPNKPGTSPYDSVWIDPDLPVRKWRGKNYKPLVAMLIKDLDSCINVNTAGNFFPLPDAQQVGVGGPVPPQYNSYSAQGLGPWEVNPARVLGNNNEAAQLSRLPIVWRTAMDPPGPVWKYGNPILTQRFGGDTQPNRKFRTYPNETIFLNQPSPGTGANFFSQVNFDGYFGQPAGPRFADLSTGHETNMVFGQPYSGSLGNMADPPRPNSGSRYGNGMYVPGFHDERTHHLSMNNPYWLRPYANASTGVDRGFGVEELRFLNEKFNYAFGEQFTGSHLAALAPQTLGNPYFGSSQLNSRHAVTPISNDLNWPGAGPWLGAPSSSYVLNGLYPTGQAQTLTPTSFAQPAPGSNPMLPAPDHDQFYRAKLSAFGPVDLDRKLTDYRLFSNQPLGPDNIGNRFRAIKDRQNLAADIFARLRYATTGQTGNITAGPGTPAYNAQRWLAQLSVNIVDYIDNDDLMTPFQWNSNAGVFTDGYVYGYERNRLVMNETYLRYENAPGDTGNAVMGSNNREAASPYSLRAWIELHNPITPASPGEQALDPMGDDGTLGGYRVRLEEQVRQNAAMANPKTPQSAYRVLIYQVPAAAGGNDPMQMRLADNVLGVPRAGGAFPAQPAGWPKIVDFKADPAKVTSAPGGKMIQPNIGAQLNGSSFYVIGPDHDVPTGMNDARLPDGSVIANLTHTELRMEIPRADVDGNNRPTWSPAFVLQRLANPYEVFSGPPDPAQPPADLTNPYVTVDYLEADTSRVSMYDHVTYRHDHLRGPDGPETMAQDLNLTFAWGRRQPYDARINYNDSAHYRQGAGGAAMGTIGGQTFSRHNAKNGVWPAAANAGAYVGGVTESPGAQTNDTLQQPFLPMNHLDRILLNPAELLHVVAVKPSELTQAFFMAPTDIADPTKRRVAYTANWLDAPDSLITANRSTFLFRALDFLRTPSWMEGIPTGGRVPGRVNPNTIFADITGASAPAQFSAVADPSASNRFVQGHVDNAWSSFMGNVPYPPGRHQSPGQISSQDRPYKGSAIAVESSGLFNAGASNGFNSQDRTMVRMGALWQNNTNDEAFLPATGPYGATQKYELLSKTLNQVTTRSNCFMMHATIGYFEVMNEGPYNEVNRPVLGKEIGDDDGSVLRHRFFAVLDRTNLTIEQPGGANQPIRQGQPPVFMQYQPFVQLPSGPGFQIFPDPDVPLIPPTPPGGGGTDRAQIMVRVPALSQILNAGGKTISLTGYYDGTPWNMMDDPSVPPGPNKLISYGVLGSGSSQEFVKIYLPNNALDATTGSANIILEIYDPANTTTNASPPLQFKYQHHRGESLRLMNPDPRQPAAFTLGNPGPQAGFQYRAPRYTPIVRYAEQLK